MAAIYERAGRRRIWFVAYLFIYVLFLELITLLKLNQEGGSW